MTQRCVVCLAAGRGGASRLRCMDAGTSVSQRIDRTWQCTIKLCKLLCKTAVATRYKRVKYDDQTGVLLCMESNL